MCVKLEGGGAKEDDEGGDYFTVADGQWYVLATSGREATSTAATDS